MEQALNVVNDTQPSVVETAAPETSDIESMCQTDVTPRQSAADNSAFRRLRLENERLRAENEEYEALAVERRMREDLEAIRLLDPAVGSLEELGEDFEKLVASGIDAPLAFLALRQAQRAVLPPEIGEVGDTGAGKEYYSPEEVDALSAKQLSDPGIWQRVRKSMTKW